MVSNRVNIDDYTPGEAPISLERLDDSLQTTFPEGQ